MGSIKPQSLENIERLKIAPAAGKFRMLSLYAAVGMLIAVVGVYGLVSQITLYRRKECLIRVALGATSWGIGFLLMRSLAKSLSGGALLGLAVAWMSTRLTQASVYGLADPDPLSMIVAVGAVLFFAVAAAIIPIYRLCRHGLQPS
jgi:ABC-type antimicrobial peptide transport system permease subunit